MKNLNPLLVILFSFLFCSLSNAQKLTGTLIGSEWSVDYDNGNAMSKSAHYHQDAFDDDLSTFYAAYDRSGGWVGLDLGKPHVITSVGYAPRQGWAQRLQLGVFEGANRPDFLDAIPIFIIKETPPAGYTQSEVNCSRAFRYVRYVGPSDVRCNIAEVGFYGYESAGSDKQLYQITNLPTVIINTVGSKEINSKHTEVGCQVMIISDDGKKQLTDTESLVRGRGNASWDFPKKPYRIRFSMKRTVLNSKAKAKKWTLINNYGDKTLMRNLVAFEISRRLDMPYTPFAEPVDVIVNGEYKGCYQLCDQIDVKKNRVDIEEMSQKDISLPNISGGYLIEVDAYAGSEESMFYSMYGNPVTIKYPKADSITTQQANYIQTHFESMERAVYNGNYYGLLDLNTFLKHFIVGELSGNTDTYWSMNLYKHRNNDTLYVGPVWDFDLAFENDQRTYPINNLSDYVYCTRGSSAGSIKNIVNKIVKDDPVAVEQLSYWWSWAQVRKGLTAENLNNYVDSMAQVLEESQTLNFRRWPILNQRVHQNPRTYGSYYGEVLNVKTYITKRFTKLSQWIKPVYIEPEENTNNALLAVSPNSFIYKVFNAQGLLLYSGAAESKMQIIQRLKNNGATTGIYIIQTPTQTDKIIIR